MKRLPLGLFGLGLAIALALPAGAGDWPQWRGPDRDGQTDESFNADFAKDGLDIKWSKDIGVGFTGVTVADGLAYTAGWKDDTTTFYCFDADTGKQAWSYSFPTEKYGEMNVGGPSGTAAVDDGRVYHMARDGKTYCYDAENGRIIWGRDLAKDYGVKVPRWGFSGSPVVIGDVLYLDIGRIIALNKKTGINIWKTDDLGPAYSTPAPLTFDGKDYLAVFPRTGLYIIERDTGKNVAHHPWKTDYGVHAATPVIIDDQVFISSEYNTGCAMLRFTGKGLDLLWENRKMQNKMDTCLYLDGYLYGSDSRNLACIDIKTGDQVWDKPMRAHTNVIASGNTLIVLTDKGELLTAPASAKGFKPTSRVQIITGDSTVWTAPTLADGKLFVRGSKGKLVCIDVSE